MIEPNLRRMARQIAAGQVNIMLVVFEIEYVHGFIKLYVPARNTAICALRCHLAEVSPGCVLERDVYAPNGHPTDYLHAFGLAILGRNPYRLVCQEPFGCVGVSPIGAQLGE